VLPISRIGPGTDSPSATSSLIEPSAYSTTERQVTGPILEIGNTNSRYRFPIGARAFVENWNVQGPAHHCAVGVGHIARKIEKLGKLMGMETVKVC
jgi:L-arabinose isomerase